VSPGALNRIGSKSFVNGRKVGHSIVLGIVDQAGGVEREDKEGGRKNVGGRKS